MRVVDSKNPKTMAFDVPSGLAAILIREGFVVAWQEAKPKDPVHELVWSVQRFKEDGSPYILGQCNVCNPRIVYRGREPEKFVTRTQWHGDVCPPPDVVHKYAALIKAYFVDALQKGQPEKEVARIRL